MTDKEYWVKIAEQKIREEGEDLKKYATFTSYKRTKKSKKRMSKHDDRAKNIPHR